MFSRGWLFPLNVLTGLFSQWIDWYFPDYKVLSETYCLYIAIIAVPLNSSGKVFEVISFFVFNEFRQPSFTNIAKWISYRKSVLLCYTLVILSMIVSLFVRRILMSNGTWNLVLYTRIRSFLTCLMGAIKPISNKLGESAERSLTMNLSKSTQTTLSWIQKMTCFI